MPSVTELSNCDQKGSEMSLYYDTADDPTVAGGSGCATPVWVFNKAVTGDMNINETEDEEEHSSRDPEMLYKQYSESKPDLEISGELMVDPAYDGFIYMNAMRSGSFARNILVLTSYLTNVGSMGFRGKFRNFDRSISGPESGPGRQQFKLKPAACVKSGCKITTVRVVTSGTVSSYDPGVFNIAAARSSAEVAQEIADSAVYQGLNRTSAETVYTDVAPLITFLGAEAVDDLVTSLVETSPVPQEASSRSAVRVKPKATGVGGFERLALVKALDEIVLNEKVSMPEWLRAVKFPK